MKTQHEGSCLQAGTQVSPGAKSARTLILDFWTPELLEIHFCCLNHPVYGMLLWQPEQTKTSIYFLNVDQNFSIPVSPSLLSLLTLPRYEVLYKERKIRLTDAPLCSRVVKRKALVCLHSNLTFTSSVTLRKLLNLSVPQFPQLKYNVYCAFLSCSYFGHLIRRANSLEKTLMLGKIEGKRRRGWQRVRRLDSITDSMDMNCSKLWEIVKYRGAWCAAVHGVAKSLI